MTKEYTSDDIDVLDSVQYVRLRTHNYFGNTNLHEVNVPIFNDDAPIHQQTHSFVPATLKAVEEIIDNCIDEFHDGEINKPILTIKADCQNGHYIISDNGRGVPIDKHKKMNQHTPEVIFGTLMSGRNFKDDKNTGVRGQNGVGSSCVNFCSTQFNVTVTRDGKKYKQQFSQGSTKRTKPSITSTKSKQTGTEVEFKLDPQVFSDIQLPSEIIESKAIELAMCNPGMKVCLSDINGKNKKTYHFTSTDQAMKKYCGSNKFYSFSGPDTNIYILADYHDDDTEIVNSWVNSSYLIDGGLCNTQLSNAFFSKLEQTFLKMPEFKGSNSKTSIDKRAMKQGLGIFCFVNVTNPTYDAQHKSRLTGPNLRDHFTTVIDNNWNKFRQQAKNNLFEQIKARLTDASRNQKVKEFEKKIKNNKTKSIKGFLDATGKDRTQCILLITEGMSASSRIKEVRDPTTHGTYELGGKVNNVYGSGVKQLEEMGKYTDLLSVIGLVPGKKADKSKLNFGKIFITTDADTDGDDIFTLLVNMFYQFWPELMDPNDPILYRLLAPNVVASKNNKRIHFQTQQEFEKQQHKYKNYQIEYMKGLGGMSEEDWRLMLDNLDQVAIPLPADDKIDQALDLLFSPDVEKRKKWLTKQD